jgi:hypothetical protein
VDQQLGKIVMDVLDAVTEALDAAPDSLRDNPWVLLVAVAAIAAVFVFKKRGLLVRLAVLMIAVIALAAYAGRL